MMIRRGLYAAAGVLVLSSLASGQNTSPSAPGTSNEQEMATTEHTMMTTEQKIRNAASAAPASISSEATIMDWPTEQARRVLVAREADDDTDNVGVVLHTEEPKPVVLREDATEKTVWGPEWGEDVPIGARPAILRHGSNGWTCFPDMPHTKGNDPMCLDESWMAWLEGYLNHRDPVITRVGIGYMIAPGGAWTSNTDPYATEEVPDNQWGYDPPHLMIVLPNVDALKGLPTDRMGGSSPWVMYPNTPYAHIMVPVSAPSAVRGTR